MGQLLHRARIRWHGIKLGKPDWDENSHTVAFTLQASGKWFHIMFNAYWKPLEFELPPLPGHGTRHWERIVDTYLDSSKDFCPPSEATVIEAHEYEVQARSVVLLLADVADADRIS